MDEYPNNSNAYRAQSTLNKPVDTPEKKQEDVKPEEVVAYRKKKKEKTSSIFFKEDIKSVGRYIVHDILIPALKKTLVAMVNNGTNMMVYGEQRPYADDRDRDYRGKASYQSYWDRDRDYYGRREAPQRITDPTLPYDELVYKSKGKAVDVLSQMRKQIYDRGYVSIAFMYEQSYMPAEATLYHYGWRNLDYAEVKTLSDGYWLKLPRAEEIPL